MKLMLRVLLLVLLFTALTALFFLHGSAEAVTVLTADGPLAMSLEDYLPGAVAAEMPALYPQEALKAQAVAIRSYVRAVSPRHEEADVCCDSGCCLGWLDEPALRALWGEGYEEYREAVCAACRATEGEYLSYGGEPACAVFHASSVGQTEDSAAVWAPLPYLVSVSSPESEAAQPELASTVSVTAEAFCAALGLSSPAVTAVETDAAGRVASVTADGVSVSGEALRSAFGLRSTAFTLELSGGVFVFRVLGSGHGVGMSQTGAKLCALEGMDYREILAHYYPGTTLERTGP